MKKILCTLMIATFIIGTGVTTFANGHNYVAKEYTSVVKECTTVEEAKNIALKNVGLKAGDVFFTKAKQDTEHGRKVWEIEFIYGNKEYEFDIDVQTSRILDVDVDYGD